MMMTKQLSVLSRTESMDPTDTGGGGGGSGGGGGGGGGGGRADAALDRSWFEKLRYLNHLVWGETKRTYLVKILKASTDRDGAKLKLQRTEGMLDNPFLSLFKQAFDQLHVRGGALFRSACAESGTRPWDVEDSSGGSGKGLFFSSLSEIVTVDLMPVGGKPVVPLFMRLDGGAMFPSPRFDRPKDLAMYEFVGELMGCALRLGTKLPFMLADSVWKAILGYERRDEDVFLDDPAFKAHIRTLDGMQDADTVAGMHKTFQVEMADKCRRNLVPHGQHKDLTLGNKDQFIHLWLLARRRESRHQMAAMSRGLARVAPLPVLRALFTWQELENVVCGPRTMDVDALRKKTRWKFEGELVVGLGAERSEDIWWDMIASLGSEEDKGAVLQFWTGLSRGIPSDHLSIESGGGGTDRLPRAAVCFNSLKLQKYSSVDMMRRLVLVAATMDSGFGAEQGGREDFGGRDSEAYARNAVLRADADAFDGTEVRDISTT